MQGAGQYRKLSAVTNKPSQAHHGPPLVSRHGLGVPGRRHSLHVARFRDDHRAQQLVETGKEFAEDWVRAVTQGPSQELQDHMQSLLDPSMVALEKGLLGTHGAQDPEHLADLLKADHRYLSQVGKLDGRCVVCAANDDDDTAFCLTEISTQDKQGQRQAAYQVLRGEILLDETARRITQLQVMHSQMASHGHVVAQTHQPAPADVFLSTAFPVDRILQVPFGLNPTSAKRSAAMWCRSFNTGQKEDILDEVVSPEFMLWDAQGLLPLMCADSSKSVSDDSCVVAYDNLKAAIRDMKEHYDIRCVIMDNSVSHTHNVGFTHWLMYMRPRHHGNSKPAGVEFELEGMQLEIFAPTTGRLTDVWLFTDPFPLDATERRAE